MAEKAAIASEALELDIDDRGIHWSEGSLLDVSGELQGPGFQFYAPARDEPLFYTTQVTGSPEPSPVSLSKGSSGWTTVISRTA